MKKVCYTVVLQSQLGPRAGELLLQEDAGTVSGELRLLSWRNRFSGSVLQNGKYPGPPAGGLVTCHGCWDLTGVEAPAAPRETERPAAVGG